MPNSGVVGDVAVIPSFPGLIIFFKGIRKLAGMKISIFIPLYFLTVSLFSCWVFSWFLGHR